MHTHGVENTSRIRKDEKKKKFGHTRCHNKSYGLQRKSKLFYQWYGLEKEKKIDDM